MRGAVYALSELIWFRPWWRCLLFFSLSVSFLFFVDYPLSLSSLVICFFCSPTALCFWWTPSLSWTRCIHFDGKRRVSFVGGKTHSLSCERLRRSCVLLHESNASIAFFLVVLCLQNVVCCERTCSRIPLPSTSSLRFQPSPLFPLSFSACFGIVCEHPPHPFSV